MFNRLSEYNIILGSGSPRRKEILENVGFTFVVKPSPASDESFPIGLTCEEVAAYISEKKAKAFQGLLTDNEIVITADTIVCLGDTIMGKPADMAEAVDMLQQLSGRTHQVITGVTILSKEKHTTFYDVTNVTFESLTPAMIEHYVTNYRPFDKAGSYGIQEWIGMVGVSSIEGSYYNVMGLPIHRVVQELFRFIESSFQ